MLIYIYQNWLLSDIRQVVELWRPQIERMLCLESHQSTAKSLMDLEQTLVVCHDKQYASYQA